METTLYNISQVLGISIIQSLWQGMLVYIVLRIVFATAPSLSSVKKYYLAVFAMLSVFALFIYSLVNEAGSRNWAAVKPGSLSTALPGLNLHGNVAFNPDFYGRLAVYMPYICAIYFAGLLGNLLKLAWEWNKIIRIRRSVICAEQMQQFINKFSKKLDIAKPILLKFSNLIDVPCMTGFFKPLILLPVSLSTHLSACEVESILLHELAHIKRNDYLANLLQQVISVMLFFNPFSRLINRIINQERENSCDDLVVEKTGKPLIYAQALLKLEAARVRDFQLALAVTGKKFYLLKRIERIMKTQNQPGNMRHFFIAALLLAGGLCSVAWFNPVYGKLKNVKSASAVYVLKGNTMLPADTTEYMQLTDTGKHKTKPARAKTLTKTLTKKHTAVKKLKDEDADEYSDDTTGYFRSPEWKAQMAAIQKQSEELKKQFNSPEWKAQQEQWKKMGEEMKKQFDSPEWKAQQEQWKTQALAMQKQFNSPEWKAQQEQWKKMGEDLKKQFDSPEWKAQQEQWKKQAEDLKKQFDSPEWKAQQEQWKKMGEDMSKQFDSPEWKAQQEVWKKQAEQFKKQFNSPEWKAQQEVWKKQAEQFKKQFNSPEWKEQIEQLKNMSKELKKQFDNKEWKNQKWMLKDSTGGVDIYKPAPKDTVK